MTNRTENQINGMLRTIKRRRWQALLLVCLALVVIAGVAGLFHLPAIAKTYQVTELTCTAVPPEGAACADFFVHIHNDVDCFDAEGNLVCPLPEIRPHRHTEECYSATGELICTIPEVLLHTHTDDCYQKNEDGSIYVDEDGNTWLICGQLQVLEHVHGPECFTTYELDDGEPEETGTEPSFYPDNASDAANTEGEESGLVFLFPLEDEADEQPAESVNQEAETGDDAATDNGDTEPADEKTSDAAENTDLKTGEDPAKETAQETVSESMPAEHFEAESAGVLVTVDAPEGAFPKGTTMVVSQVEMDDDTLSNVTGAVENGSDQKVVTAQAVDISFFDAEGNLIEPKLPIKVSMKSAIVSESENVALVHLAETETAENETPEAPAAPTAEVVADVQVVENPNEDNEIQFESDAFSVYVLVGTETITTRYLTADGQTYLITVTCGPEAKIPEGAGLAVAEIPQDSEEYANYLAQAQSAVNAGAAAGAAGETGANGTSETDSTESSGGTADRVTVTTARFFDITILDAEGNPVEPAAPVDVKIEYMEPAETAENYQVVHFGAETEVLNPAVSGTEGTASAFDFQTNSFSVFGVVGTKIIEADVLLSDGNLYTVSVIYDESANIPSGSRLTVVPFEEGTAEYEYARNSVLADKKARGEWVDLGSFGLAALDISILNPDGVEIEPEAPVQVEIRIKELPGVEDLNMVADTLAIQHHVEVEDGVVVETVFDGNAAAAFRLETNETLAAEGTVVDPNSVSEEDFAAPVLEETGLLAAEFTSDAFSTFTISWRNANGNGTRIHYVDESGHELTVNNTTLPTTIGENSTSPAYLIYDIEGYEYSHTYYNNPNTRIYPQLFKASGWNGWTYYQGWAYYNADGQGKLLGNNQDVYVVYKKKADIAKGGTPTVKQSGDVEPPVDPRIDKTSTPNGDDTNTLALSLISDTAKLEVEKLADVIVVFDVSGSMNDAMGNTTRLQAAKDAVNNLATHLAEKKNSEGEPLVRMSLIQFSTKASTVLGMTDLTTTGQNNGLSRIKSAVNGLSAEGGTNWDHALQLANEENDLDTGRATFVIFVTDGDPTFRNARMDVTDYDLQGETNDQALNIYGQESPNPWYLEDNVYGPGDNDKTGKCYEAAVVQGNAIVSAKKNIYTIGISNDVTKVGTFNSAIHGSGAYLASNSSALQQAFADIEASISGASGWGNIQMTDGITNLSNTVQKTGLTNVGGDFTYWKAPAPANWATMTKAQKDAYTAPASAFEPWKPEDAGAALAQYNEATGAVEWNMGSTFMPEAGVTYQVRFKVWPSQEAYDYIAKLNNGTLNYDTLPEDVKAQIIKNGNTYMLKTNEPDAKTTYQAATKTGETVTVSGDTKTLMFPTVEDLNLSVDKMKVTKAWINDLDPDARWKSDVTLLLTDGAGNLYKSIALNEKNNYTAEDNFISCGLAKIESGELVIYEKGHDFKLTEPAEYAYYWDLDSQIYRPMVIDAQLTMLMKTDAPSGMGDQTYYVEQGTSYYKIDGGTYKAISTGDAAASITATNIRRSNLNLTKKVVDKEGNPVVSSEAFAFTITINDPKDADVWFSVQTDPNDTSTIVKDLETNATAEVRDGKKTGYYHAASRSQITVSIEPGWNLRFTNLPNGTRYTITENPGENCTFKSAVIDNNGTFTVDSSTATGNGTIDKSNTQYTVTYTNETRTQQVIILKTSQDGETPLPGAVFSLYTDRGYTADPKTPSKTDLTSGADGKIDLGALAYGTYYLVETKAPDGFNMLTNPVRIVVSKDGARSQQSDYRGNQPIKAAEGASENEDDETTGTVYQVVVTNNPGVELPSTGGEGTLIFSVLGSILFLSSTLLILAKRRQEAYTPRH